MEEKKKHISENWVYIDEIISQIWKEDWEQLTPPEESILKDAIEKKEIQEFKIVTLPAGMFCVFSASLENMYYIMSIVFMVIQSLELFRRRIKRSLTEKEIEKMIEDAIELHNKEEQKVINQLLPDKRDELIREVKKVADKIKKK